VVGAWYCIIIFNHLDHLQGEGYMTTTTETHELKKIVEAVELATTRPGYWFRGHDKIIGKLEPKIFREENKKLSVVGRIESLFLDEFRRVAPSLEPHIPEWNDYLSWLFLAQHHGLPTRLLDWTQNILLALYFATHQTDEDGELWVMNPNGLNMQGRIKYGERSNGEIATANDWEIGYSAEEAFFSGQEMKEKVDVRYPDNKDGHLPTYPLALLPTMTFPGLVSQLSAFTIHPPYNAAHTIPEILIEPIYLVRYIIPTSRKEQLREDFAVLGIIERTLFQDLDITI
jgi:hypothetical protein